MICSHLLAAIITYSLPFHLHVIEILMMLLWCWWTPREINAWTLISLLLCIHLYNYYYCLTSWGGSNFRNKVIINHNNNSITLRINFMLLLLLMLSRCLIIYRIVFNHYLAIIINWVLFQFFITFAYCLILYYYYYLLLL